jgi:hypothetical protein
MLPTHPLLLLLKIFKLLNHRFIMWRNVGGEKVGADAQIIFKKKGKNGIEKIFWNGKKNPNFQ